MYVSDTPITAVIKLRALVCWIYRGPLLRGREIRLDKGVFKKGLVLYTFWNFALRNKARENMRAKKKKDRSIRIKPGVKIRLSYILCPPV